MISGSRRLITVASAAREAILVALQRGLGRRLAGRRGRHDRGPSRALPVAAR